MHVMMRRVNLLVALQPALVRDALALHERRPRPPLCALARRRDLGVQLVDLLERPALGLVDEQVHKGDAQEAAAEPDEEDLGLQVGVARAVVDEVRRRVGDGPVEKPLSVSARVHASKHVRGHSRWWRS